MSEAIPDRLCGNCVGACCRGRMTMALSGKEAETLKSAGTSLVEFLPAGDDVDWGNRQYRSRYAADKPKFIKKRAKTLEPGHGLYGRDSICGFLEETSEGFSVCGLQDQPELKPRVCEDYEAGSSACRRVRKEVIRDMISNDELVELSLVGVALGEKALLAVQEA